MQRQVAPAILLVLLLFAPSVCLAQASPPQPLLDLRYQELLSWLDEYASWEAWAMKWGNRVAYNSAGGIVKKRPLRPEPPAWLWADCQSVIGAEGALARACSILSRWRDVSPFLLSGRHASGQPQTDVVPKSSFLQRVHLSGGWVPAQLPAPKVYLVAGMQVGIVEVGRVTLPAVGVGLMALADGSGGYEWKPATVFGIGYRLTSFAFPWVKREANLHINVARATVHGVRNVPLGLDPSQNLIGFSLTFAKR
ncbi:MAG TPA: hypothetical protein VMO26_20475 [Vicinamibacterales bacterium]|nr:hypothetical protein [Vicinamibacterales bacterium]